MKLYCHKIKLNSQGYTSKGEYFGVGMPLYWYETEDCSVQGYVRAYNRRDAIHKIHAIHPNDPTVIDAYELVAL
jgi:hypothetical protein